LTSGLLLLSIGSMEMNCKITRSPSINDTIMFIANGVLNYEHVIELNYDTTHQLYHKIYSQIARIFPQIVGIYVQIVRMYAQIVRIYA